MSSVRADACLSLFAGTAVTLNCEALSLCCTQETFVAVLIWLSNQMPTPSPSLETAVTPSCRVLFPMLSPERLSLVGGTRQTRCLPPVYPPELQWHSLCAARYKIQLLGWLVHWSDYLPLSPEEESLPNGAHSCWSCFQGVWGAVITLEGDLQSGVG